MSLAKMRMKFILRLTCLLLAPLPALPAANSSTQGSARRDQPPEPLQATLEPANPNGVFPAGTDLEVTLRLTNSSARQMEGTLECEWTTDLCEEPRVLAQAPAEPFVLAAGQVITRNFTYRPGGPGFYPVTAVVKFGEGRSVRVKLAPGYDVGHIQGPAARPADFDSFWEARLKDLAGVKPEFSVEPVPERSTATACGVLSIAEVADPPSPE